MKTEKDVGDMKRLQSEELYNFYTSTNITGAIESIGMR
jgi:hypothetical protein